MCDDDCFAILDKNVINILKGRTLILKGHRNKIDGLWYIPISIPVRDSAMENHHTGQDKDRTNPISSWMLFQPDTKNFPEGDK